MKWILFLLFLPITLTAQPRVSKYLTYKEAYQSKGYPGIPNVPTPTQKRLIERFGKEFFDPLRERVGSPLYVSSLFRGPALNKAVKGAKYSDHQVLGNVVACDIDQDGRGKVGNRALFFIIKDECVYYKLIFEYGDSVKGPAWVHVSWSSDPVKNNMKKVYRALKRGNRTIYVDFATGPLN